MMNFPFYFFFFPTRAACDFRLWPQEGGGDVSLLTFIPRGSVAGKSSVVRMNIQSWMWECVWMAQGHTGYSVFLRALEYTIEHPP